MNDRDCNIIGELLNLFYRHQYEAQSEKNEDLEKRIHSLRVSLDIERDRTRMMSHTIEMLRAELLHMDQKFESYLTVFDRIFRFEGENVREPVQLYVEQVHQVHGYMDDVLDLLAEYETDPEFDFLMETIVEDSD